MSQSIFVLFFVVLVYFIYGVIDVFFDASIMQRSVVRSSVFFMLGFLDVQSYDVEHFVVHWFDVQLFDIHFDVQYVYPQRTR
jgi:hypothetical protein